MLLHFQMCDPFVFQWVFLAAFTVYSKLYCSRNIHREVEDDRMFLISFGVKKLHFTQRASLDRFCFEVNTKGVLLLFPRLMAEGGDYCQALRRTTESYEVMRVYCEESTN